MQRTRHGAWSLILGGLAMVGLAVIGSRLSLVTGIPDPLAMGDGTRATKTAPDVGHGEHSHGHEHGHSHAHEPIRVRDEDAYRPTAIPDRMILTWAGDPRTTQAVTWRTDTSVTTAQAEIVEAGEGSDFVQYARTVPARTTPFRSDLGQAHYHSVNFTGLTPKTKYAYRVGDGVNWSEWQHFTTASGQPEPFSFVYFGDAQNQLKSLWSRVVREAYSDAPKARFLLHAGDLINRSTRDAEWGEWFYAGGWINGTTPSIVTPGNHEYGDGRLARHWRMIYTLPEDGPEGLEETVYSLDYQGARIIALNSNEKQAEQAAWLEAKLADNPNRWTIVTFHHPIYSSAGGRDNTKLRALWQPLFDKYHVDLVLQGHDHTYARTGLMTHENLPTGVSARDPHGGTVYVVSISGPKMYTVDREPYMSRVAENTQLYQIITVDGDQLRYEARTAVGRLYDAFTLRKRDGHPNELIEQIPDTPERRWQVK